MDNEDMKFLWVENHYYTNGVSLPHTDKPIEK